MKELLNKVIIIISEVFPRPDHAIEYDRQKNLKRAEYIEIHNNQRNQHIAKLAKARERRKLKELIDVEMGA